VEGSLARCEWLGGSLTCSDADFELLSSNTVKLRLRGGSSSVLFVTGTPKRVICSGSRFQVFVWGEHTAFLWEVREPEAFCVLLDGCSFEDLGSEVYYVCSTMKPASGEYAEVVWLAELVKRVCGGKPLFLVEYSLPEGFEAENIVQVRTSIEGDLEAHALKLLAKLLGNRTLAERALAFMKNGLIPIELVEKPDILKRIVADLPMQGGLNAVR